ncbi:hypothetical protein HYO65_gp296 [Tenacibaculum phage PTm1]|uniref:Uncharacterized protein n=2 Tax=Shirahamavirus PTm1 TaxID=2846435 RepID=A0A5S9HXI6_9CAUD|nr:hypothetical protein HYO65_gp296 [Tenacibaculum phage PTm1]BBI90688.1 hypothetical protein [Tenacibaculum phage PTm1]BBI90995.1 hypothetical protein [Tenacibaculum phage PTm5]
MLLEFGSDDRYSRIFSRELVQTNRNRLSISRLSTTLDRTNKYKETYLRDIMFSNFYQYSSPSNNNDLQSRKGLPWISNCMEFRSYTSIVLNSSEVLNLNITKSDENDLATDLIEQLKIYCPLSEFTLTSEIKRDILNLKYDVSNLTEPNYNIQNEIVSNFIKNTFLSVYELESVQLVDEIFVNFVVYDSILNILDSVPNGTNLNLTFRR